MIDSNRTFHEFANIFPMMSDGDIDSLAADIKKNGQRENIWLHPDGSILDGRNRYRACSEAGVKPRFATYSGDTSSIALVRFVVSLNLHRRHLSSDQKAAIAVEAQEIVAKLGREAKERQREHGGTSPGKPKTLTQKIAEVSKVDGESREQLAELFDTNRQYVSDMKKLREKDPEAFAAVKSGEKKLVQVKREKKEEAREARRDENRRLVQSTPEIAAAVEKAKFATIVIDPPWDWGDEGDCDQLGRARPQYSTMTLDQLLNLPVGERADVDCHIYLWITNRSLPKGFSLLEKWGFRYVTCLTWCKPSFGMGNYFRGSTEQILFGVRGSQPLKRKNVGTWFEAARGPNGHSSKPVEFYDLVESCSPGPYLEIFARSNRDGWVHWGAEA